MGAISASRSVPGTSASLSPPRIRHSRRARFLMSRPREISFDLRHRIIAPSSARAPSSVPNAQGCCVTRPWRPVMREGAQVFLIWRVLAQEEDPVPRAHAAWALGELGELEALQAALDSEQDPEGIGRDPARPRWYRRLRSGAGGCRKGAWRVGWNRRNNIDQNN